MSAEEPRSMRRIPNFVLTRNRNNSYADQQAQGYTRRPRYLLGRADGVRPIEDFPKWLTTQSLTPRDRRLIDELRVGEAMTLPNGDVLHCEPPVEAE